MARRGGATRRCTWRPRSARLWRSSRRCWRAARTRRPRTATARRRTRWPLRSAPTTTSSPRLLERRLREPRWARVASAPQACSSMLHLFSFPCRVPVPAKAAPPPLHRRDTDRWGAPAHERAPSTRATAHPLTQQLRSAPLRRGSHTGSCGAATSRGCACACVASVATARRSRAAVRAEHTVRSRGASARAALAP